MSGNIKYEAVFPPAIHNLKRMDHLSPTLNGAKGSYELYEPQQKIYVSLRENKANSDTAPGSQCAAQDLKQTVTKLQQDLVVFKQRETELEQIVTELRNHDCPTSPSFLESQYLDASPSNDSIAENVKDAHIKHLQRQITVLQATLYKSEGWSNRVSDAVKERDKALDDVAQLTSEIRAMQEENDQLIRQVNMLSSALQEAKQNMLQVTDELQLQSNNMQMVTQLREEIQRQKNEIKTLKESVNCLDLENRTLKDSPPEGSNQSLGNKACSQELEHLHKVVDTLKTTVLEQRAYLLHLRQINSINTKSSSLSSTPVISNGQSDRDLTLQTADICSPKTRSADINLLQSEDPFRNIPQNAVFGHLRLMASGKFTNTRENLLNIQEGCQAGSSTQHGGIDSSRKQNSRDTLDEFSDPNTVTLSNLLPNRDGFLNTDSRSPCDVSNRILYSYTASHNQRGSPGQMLNGDGKNLRNEMLAHEMLRSPHHISFQEKASQADVADDCCHDQGSSQQNAYMWQIRQPNVTSVNNSSVIGPNFDKAGIVQLNLGLFENQTYRYHQPSGPTIPAQQESAGRIFEGELLPLDKPMAFLENGAQMNFDMFKSSLGGRIQVPAPLSYHKAQGGGHQALYMNTSGQDIGVTASSSDPTRSRINSDMLCPVCNKDYSQLSIEDFQIHVFECFDEDTGPETMKPQSLPNRTCPMCHVYFGHWTTQTDYEKHVHAHFGEELAGQNTVLQS